MIEQVAADQGGEAFSKADVAGAQKMVHTGDVLKDIGKNTKDFWQGIAPKDQTFFDQVEQGIGQLAVQLPLFAISAPAGVAMMWGQGTDQITEKIEKDKVSQQADQSMQALEILSGGVITAVTEYAASKLMLDKIPQKIALKNMLMSHAARIAAGTVTEGVQEFSENILQDVAHIAMISPESRVGLMDAIQAGGVGAIVGGIASGVISGALHIRGAKMQKALMNLSDATKVQELKARDPETYQGFADAVAGHLASTSEGAVENLYIDANTFAQQAAQANLDPSQAMADMGLDPQTYEEARVTGGDVVIPINTYIGKVAGTEVGDILSPHLRSTPDSLSMAEIQEAAKMGGDMQKVSDEIIAKQAERSEFAKSANEVRKSVFDQIVQSEAYSAPAARAYAAMVRDFCVTQADNLGVTPMEFYQAHPYKVVTGEIGQGTQGRNKELWQMTKDEYEAAKQAQKTGPALSHEQAVQQAISEGKPVQPEVIKDYPAIAEEQKDTFVLSKSGTPDLGVIYETAAKNAGVPSAVIRMQYGNDGRGGIHIALAKGGKRLKDIVNAGYGGVSDFVESVARNYSQIWKQPNGRLMLVQKNGDAKLAVLELSKNDDGHYYDVITAFIADSGYPARGDRKLLWERSVPVSAGTEKTAPLLDTTLESSGSQLGGTGHSGQSTSNIAPTDDNVKGNEGNLYQHAIPVASLKGDEVGSDITSDNAVELAREYYKSNLQGKSVEREGFGSVRLTGKRWRKLKKGLTTDTKKTMLIPAIPDIIAKGTYNGREKPYKQRSDDIVAFHFFSGLVDLKGELIQAGVTVGEDSHGNLFYNLNHDTDALWSKSMAPHLPGAGAQGVGPSENNEALPLNVKISPAGDDVKILFQSNQFHQKSDATRRGGFNPETLTTILTQKADYSTFLHETAHFFLTTYADMAADLNASPRIQADMQTLLDWFGVPDLATWNSMRLEDQRKHHEAFAYNYEVYLFEGKSPNIKMQGVFERFSAWLKKVYISIRDEINGIYQQEHGTDLPILTGEVRQVMDRMLASDRQIQQAEQIRGMAPIFQTQAQSGMNDAEWAAYQEMQTEAHEQALAKHRTASLRQMKWLGGAKSRVLKALQAQAKDARKGIANEVTEAVNAMPIYRAEAAWKEAKKTKDIAAQMAVLDSFGYSSVEALETAVKAQRKKTDEIRRLTDIRMLEEHGELTDPKALANAVDAAVHNEARARFIGVELRYMAKTERPVRVMQEAARQAARALLGKRTIGTIRPSDFSAAEAKAAASAEKAMKQGDIATATQAKEHQLLQNQLAAEAIKANAQTAKSLEMYKKVFSSDKRLGKSRDMNYVETARAILAHYGIGNSEQPSSYYLAKIKAYDPEFYAEIEPMITAHQMQSRPIKQLTLDEFTDLFDQVQALWHLSRRNKQIEIDGQLVERTAAVEELNDAIRELTKPGLRPGYDKAMTKWQDTKINLMGMRAALRRVEAWVDAMDKGKPDGPFRKYIWNPISEAIAQYRMAKADYMTQYINLLKGIEPLMKKNVVVASEIGYTFNTVNSSELLHAILHTGNESNKRKLLLGRGWAILNDDGTTMDTSRWDAFITRAQREGILTKAHYDFPQSVWDLMEKMTPAAQKAHRQMYGFYFDEITAKPFDTPFGVYAGGYVPAVTDPNMVTEGAMRNEQETQAVNNSYMFPTTGRGFTRSRVEYNKPLLLNLGYLAGHIDKALRFTHIEPRIKDVARIVKTNRSFGETMDDLDPTVRGDMLVPWLQRAAMQMVSIPSKGQAGRVADSVFRWLRTTTGMQMMVANVTNTLQQFTGLSISLLRVKPTLLRNALWQYVRQPGDTATMVFEKSDFMKTRLSNCQFEIQSTIDELLLNPNKYEKLQDFASKHGYFMQSATQGVVDTVTWVGAYNQALEDGGVEMDEKEAVRRADSAVRMTQGSFASEDISRIETGSPFLRVFTQFYSYFNMQANILGTEFLNVIRNMGFKKGAGRLFYIYVFGFMVPAVLSEMIVQAAGGFDAGDDDEYDLWDAMRIFFSGQARAIAAMVPSLGPAVIAGINTWNSKQYDDRMSTSPAVSMIESAVRAPHSVYKAIVEDGSRSRATKDLLTGLGVLTRLPLGQIAKPIGYALDVEQGNVSPESKLDYTRGLLSGKDVNRKQ